MKKEIKNLIKEIIGLSVCYIIVILIFNKVFNTNYGIENMLGFIVGVSIYKIIAMLIKNKKQV